MDHKQEIPINTSALGILLARGRGHLKYVKTFYLSVVERDKEKVEGPRLPAMSGPALPGKKRAGS